MADVKLTNATGGEIILAGIHLAPGESTTMPEDAMTGAMRLMVKGGALKTGDSAAKKPTRAERYKELVEGLTDEDMTQAGKPDLTALNALLDEGEERFTAAERDDLHAAQA